MSREKTRRIERLESKFGSDGEPKNVVAGHCFSDEELERICADWRTIVAAGGGVAEDGTRYRARVHGSTLWLMAEPITVEEWGAKYGRAA